MVMIGLVNKSAFLSRYLSNKWTQHKCWIRCFSHFYDTNQVSNTQRHSRINNSQYGKQLLGEEDVRNRVTGPPGINSDIRLYIDNANNAKDILSTLEQNVKIIEHVSIFGKAMKKCDDLRDWKIMELLLSSSLQLDRVQFSIFFNSMAHADRPELTMKYFNVMVNEYSIQPDVVCFSAILKSFRWQGKLKQAETFWHMMREKYHLEPHEFVYTEMISICAKCHEIEK
eukprot:227733_1